MWAAPIAPLGSTEGAIPAPPSQDADADYPSYDGAPKLPGLALVRDNERNSKTLVYWALDPRKLDSQDKQAVSQSFEVVLHDGLCPFRLVMHPTEINDGRRGCGFKKAKGRGRVQLKCEASRTSDSSDVVFRLAIGRGAVKQPFRSIVKNNFADSSCCGLPQREEEWNFSSAVDQFKTLLVILEFLPQEV